MANAAKQQTGSTDGAGFVAMVLAGGLGTRLRAAVADRPKVLAPVAGEPFLVHLLDQLARAGCRQVILCTGHLGEQIEQAFGSSHDGVELVYSREATPLGTAGALRYAAPLAPDDGVVVLNGDSYCDLDLAAFVAAARTTPEVARLVAVAVDDASRYGTVALDADGQVVAFAEKAAAGGPGLVNAGIYWLPTPVLRAIPKLGPCSLERDVLPSLAQFALRATTVHGAFLDIGTPASFAAAEAFFAALPAAPARPRQGLLVLDRDGTLIEERHYLADPGAVTLLPGVVEGLRAFAERGFELAIVTNQSGIGRGYFDEAALRAVHDRLERELAAAGITLRAIWHCPHHPDAGCACRKPEPELLQRALAATGYAPAQCLVVGDKQCDIDLGRRLGIRTALVRTGYGAGTERDGLCDPDFVVDTLADLALQPGVLAGVTP